MAPQMPEDVRCSNGTRLARKLRREQSPVERKLWWILRGRHLDGYKFRRQFPIGRYVADFCCYEKRLVVEVDGKQHGEMGDKDQERDAVLETAGFRVVRFWAKEIYQNQTEVLQRILYFLRE